MCFRTLASVPRCGGITSRSLLTIGTSLSTFRALCLRCAASFSFLAALMWVAAAALWAAISVRQDSFGQVLVANPTISPHSGHGAFVARGGRPLASRPLIRARRAGGVRWVCHSPAECPRGRGDQELHSAACWQKNQALSAAEPCVPRQDSDGEPPAARRRRNRPKAREPDGICPARPHEPWRAGPRRDCQIGGRRRAAGLHLAAGPKAARSGAPDQARGPPHPREGPPGTGKPERGRGKALTLRICTQRPHLGPACGRLQGFAHHGCR